MKELTVVEIVQDQALALFTKPNGLDPQLEEIARQARSFVPDLTTAKGRKSIASVAARVSKSKTAIDAAGKELVSELKKQPKLVDAERKRVRDFLDNLRDEVRQPLTDFEDAEKARIANIEALINHINECGNGFIDGEPQRFGVLLHEIQEKIIITDEWAEFKDKAIEARDTAIEKINAQIEKQRIEAEKQAELERLQAQEREREQKEREQRIASEAAENATREAEQAAEKKRIEAERVVNAEREAANKRELELKYERERAEREKLEAQREAEQAIKHAEQQEIDKRNAQEAEAKARELDLNHRKKINNEALNCLSKIGISDADGKNVLNAIARGHILNVSISY